MDTRDADLGRWTQRDAVAYEVALDTFTQLVAWCCHLADRQPERAGYWRERRAGYAAGRKALNPADPEAARRAITDNDAELRLLSAT